jgi:hypothetical membrane protein
LLISAGELSAHENLRAVPNRIWISLGIVAPSIFLVLYSIAMASDPDYTFGKNYLSDLGVGPGAWAFNSGLIIAGLFLVLFSVRGIRALLGSLTVSMLASAFLALDGLLLACIGVFTEAFDPEHYLFSISFFLTFLLTVWLMVVAMYKSKALGSFGYLFSSVVGLVGILLLPMGGDPLSETIAVFAIIVWGAGMSIAAILKSYGHVIP